ncbi:MAG: OstA family protein [Bacteroidetes bacterium]|nr:OstA family protein [Bacteroidota bacterium]
MKFLFFLLSTCLFCFTVNICMGQKPKHTSHAALPISFKNSANDSVKIVYIWNANKMREETKDSIKLQSLVGDVELQEDNTFFYCDSVVMNQKENIVEAFGNVHINDSDTTNIYSQYMKYYVDKKYAIFQKKVRMVSGKGTLLTDDLQYDMNMKIGTYINGGKVINESSVLTSKEGTYYAETKDVYFKKDVVLKDPAYDLTSDSLLYNTQSKLATFITLTHIRDSSGNTIVTKEGVYDMSNRKAQFGKRPIITQGSQRITGDHVQFDDSTGMSIADGNAVYVDSTQGISVLSNHMVANRKTKNFIATEKPLVILKQEQDSIYITADTLFSGKITDLLYADSIKRHNDSIRAEIARVKDSIHMDSVKMEKARIADSLQKKNALLAKENKDSVQSLPKVVSDSTTLKDSIEKKIEPVAKTKKKRRRERNHVAPTPPPVPPVPIPKPNIYIPLPQDQAIENSAGKTFQTDSLMGNKMVAVSSYPKKGFAVFKKLPKPVALIPKKIERKSNEKNKAVNASPNKSIAIAEPPQDDSTNRYLQAYHHVRIFTDSMQAVADSLFYSAKDSIFKLFTNPIVWANGSQITGDTIYLYTKNKKASRLYVFENAMVINKVGNDLFNQIKGNTLNGYFKDGGIDHMRAKGNAESIYYAQDEHKAFFGVNQSKASIIDMYFLNKELNKVVLRNDGEGTFSPIRKVNFDDMRLKNFKWQDDLRPKSKSELFGQ